MNYALKNDCDGATFKAGMINLSTAVYFILCMYLLKLYVNHMQVKFDEDEQTAADYSIAIQNPPQDVNDPEAYKRFFENLGEDIKVNCVTLSRNNDVLVRALVERREILERFTDLLAPGELSILYSVADACANLPAYLLFSFIYYLQEPR